MSKSVAESSRDIVSNRAVDMIFNNEDFIRKILLHVPAKSLIKFKCVCKSWLALISDPHFGYEHTNQNPNPPHSGLYFYKKFAPPNMESQTIPINGLSSLPPLDFLGNFKIIYTCNGLALYFNDTEQVYGICNPTTQKLSMLPKMIDIYITIWKVFECLAFDPSKSPHYKVIIIYITKYGADKIMIFSSETKSWKDVPLLVLPGAPATRIIFSNGALHWLTTKNVHYEFVVDSEELKSTAMAKNPNIRRDNVQFFGECGGRLFLALGGSFTYMSTILEMEWDTRTWISNYRVNFRNIIHPRVGEGSRFYVLDIVKRSNHSGLTLVLATPGGFVSYDLERKVLEVLSDFLPSEFDEIPKNLNDLGSYSYRFTDSLFPV